QPSLWDNLDQFNFPDAPPRVLQAWFPGDHGAVGGGSASNALSSGALLWIAEGAEANGLMFDHSEGSVLAQAKAEFDCVKGPVREPGFKLDFLLGEGWRRGLSKYDWVHPNARRRWAENRSYRPQPLRRFSRDLGQWRDEP